MSSPIYLMAKMMQTQALSNSIAVVDSSPNALNSKTDTASSLFTILLQSLLNQTGVEGSANTQLYGVDPTLYDTMIEQAAARYGVDSNLIKAIIKVESGFRQDAVSSCGAQGLMQLMPRTAQGLGVTNSFDPEQNINGGTDYIAQQLSRFGDVRLALAAYNAGPGYVGGLNITDASDPAQYTRISSGVRGYVDKVLAYYEAYRDMPGV